MRLGGRMTYRQAHAALCGSPDVARAAIVDLAKTGHQVRIGAVAAGQGKTRGYWETTVAVERERWVLFGADGSDRLAALSKLALTQCAAAEKAIYSAVWVLFPRRHSQRLGARRAIRTASMARLLTHLDPHRSSSSLRSWLRLLTRTPRRKRSTRCALIIFAKPGLHSLERGPTFLLLRTPRCGSMG